MDSRLSIASSSIRQSIKEATQGLVERETLADLIILSAVASEHLLVIGPPGTAKSAVVRRVAQSLGGRYFEYLLGRFTEPSEIFGPVDLRKLRTGTIETETTGMLPEADIAFLDEVFLGSTAVLNTLLGVLNERTFRRGHTKIRCPLRVCVGAANHLPEEESLSAFADRFLVHCFVESVPDFLLESLLSGGWSNSTAEPTACDALMHLDTLSASVRNANMNQVRSALSHCIRLLRKAGIQLSDRRIVKSQMLIAAAAVLAGRQHPEESDLWPLVYVIPSEEGQISAREVLAEALKTTSNQTLNAVAEDASNSPATRAARIEEQAKALFAKDSESGAESAERERWILQLESIGREIDAGFPADTLPDSLAAIKQEITRIVSEENP
ncbi:MAG: AAA family ATPase [Gammaproteobacteria bacterium]|nr:AAA family ATPase [Gammaproteobacteria bacterium]MDH5800620.1 AAA family ATPase [Gammaproteobacteria bacterium]